MVNLMGVESIGTKLLKEPRIIYICILMRVYNLLSFTHLICLCSIQGLCHNELLKTINNASYQYFILDIVRTTLLI